MPGICGGAGCDPYIRTALLRLFSDIWGEIEIKHFTNGYVAGHSFTPSTALHTMHDGTSFAVDGETSVYQRVNRIKQGADTELFHIKNDRVALTPLCKGNLAIISFDHRHLHLATEPTGLFPLYYMLCDGGLLFSSHIKPLAAATRVDRDPVGIFQFMRFRHIYAGRTLFKNIRRLQPGQALVYDIKKDTLTVYETSRSWTLKLDGTSRHEIAETYLSALIRATNRCLDGDTRHGLMISGGWDSKLLLAAMRKHLSPENIFGYSHGDINGRELTIVRRLLERCGIENHLENLDGQIFRLDRIERHFNRTEHFIFPHWYRAGHLLSKLNIRSVAAGIFGEVGGGHYTRAMMMNRWKQGCNVGARLLKLDGLLPASSKHAANNTKSVYEFVQVRNLNRHWLIREDYWNSVPDLVDRVNSDIRDHLQRLEDRGIRDVDQLLEAHLTETRACQYIAPQLRTCRAHVDIVNIYGDQELFDIASWIPTRMKIHNAMTRAVLLEYDPLLLHFPTAAALLNSQYPILLQEATRLMRRFYEVAAMKVRLRSRGRISPRLIAWYNYEFLRDGSILRKIVDTYRCEFFDGNACSAYIDNVADFTYKFELYNAQNDIMLGYTVDRMLR